MAIRKREFETGNPSDLMSLILGFLRANNGYAYSQSEIKEELVSRELQVESEEVQRVLTMLELGARIESKIIDGTTYYNYRQLVGYRAIGKYV